MPSDETLMKEQGIERKAIELRLRGRDYHRIGALLNCTTGVARGYVRKAVKALENSEIEAVTEITVIELARLDYMVGRLMQRIEMDPHDSKAYELVLKCQVRRAAFLGLDRQKEKIELSAGGLEDDALRQRAQAIMLTAGEGRGDAPK